MVLHSPLFIRPTFLLFSSTIFSFPRAFMAALSHSGFSTFLTRLCCFFLFWSCVVSVVPFHFCIPALGFLSACLMMELRCPPRSHSPAWLSWWESLSTQSRCITNLAINKCLYESYYFHTPSLWGAACQNLYINRTLCNFTFLVTQWQWRLLVYLAITGE